MSNKISLLFFGWFDSEQLLVDAPFLEVKISFIFLNRWVDYVRHELLKLILEKILALYFRRLDFVTLFTNSYTIFYSKMPNNKRQRNQVGDLKWRENVLSYTANFCEQNFYVYILSIFYWCLTILSILEHLIKLRKCPISSIVQFRQFGLFFQFCQLYRFCWFCLFRRFCRFRI